MPPTSPPGRVAWRAAWPAWLGVAVLLVVLAPLLVCVARPIRNSFYPFQLDAEEGFLLNQALRLRAGLSIYPAIEHAPYLVGNYPPVYPLLYAAVVRAPAREWSLPAGRVLVLLGAAGAALLLAGCAARVGGACWVGVLAAGLWLATWEVQHWLPFARVDFPALAFTLGGLYVFCRARGRRGFVAAGLLFVAAFYTRQTALLAPLACAWALARHRRWQPLAWLAGPAAGVGLLVFGALQGLTHGEFYRHTVTYNRNAMDWVGWRRLLKNEVWFFHHGLLRCGALALLARGVLALEQRLQRRAGRGGAGAGAATDSDRAVLRSALNAYAVLGLLSIVSYAKVGAAPNYMLEPLAAGILWLALQLGVLYGEATMAVVGAGQRRRWAGGFWALVLAAGLLMHGWDLRALAPIFRVPVWEAAELAAPRQLVDAIHQQGVRVFSEEPIFGLLANQAPACQPFIMSRLAREGQWDERPWLKQLAGGYDLLLVTEDLTQTQAYFERYTPAMAEVVRRHYQPRRERLVIPFARKQYYLWERRQSIAP